MYAEFLKELGELAEALNAIIRRPDGALPIPYITGNMCVHLDGMHIGHFHVEDEWVMYEEDDPKGGTVCPLWA